MDFDARERHKRASAAVFGLILIGLGVVFSLDRMGMYDAGQVWSWWPVAVIGVGLASIIAPKNAGDATAGAVTAAVDEGTPVEVADGFLRIAVENMANAIKQISIQRGYDVTEYTLCCFGGAGGQHACLVADALGMKRVYIHPFAGVLSAYGMGLADLRTLKEAAVERRLADDLLPELTAKLAALADRLERRPASADGLNRP